MRGKLPDLGAAADAEAAEDPGAAISEGVEEADEGGCQLGLGAGYAGTKGGVGVGRTDGEDLLEAAGGDVRSNDRDGVEVHGGGSGVEAFVGADWEVRDDAARSSGLADSGEEALYSQADNRSRIAHYINRHGVF